MVSSRKRYSSESTSEDDMEYVPNGHNQPNNKPARKPTRTPKCFSKNALMARENRLKKKMYINNLEGQVASLKQENKKLNHLVDKQSYTIDELRKEMKYLKSILANSEGISKLIKAINGSTGMAVSTSLMAEEDRKVPAVTPKEQSFDITRHPWEDCAYPSYPTPQSDSCYGSPGFEELENDGLLLDIDLPIEMDNEELLDMIDEKALDSPIIPLPIEEHNYHNSIKKEVSEDDVGVCLHVSNNKVSLEFCPSCSSNAVEGSER